MPSLLTRRARSAAGLALVAALTSVLTATGGAQPVAAAGATFSCMPANGLMTINDPLALMRGIVTLPGGRKVGIGTTGSVNWAGVTPPVDGDAKYFLSLNWVQSLIHPSRQSLYTSQQKAAFLARANLIVLSFARSVPNGGGPMPAAGWSGMYAGQRTTLLACLASYVPSSTLTAALRRHGAWLADPAHDPGDWNQGVDAAIGLLASGCAGGVPTYATTAVTRFSRMIRTTIDVQGAIGEQAPGYGPYLYQRWGVAADKIAECGLAVPVLIAQRRAGLLDFLSWATEPSSSTVQLGDTAATPSLGLRTAATPTKAFDAGYVFGRSSTTSTPSSLYYTLRFGPGRAYHGHEDHTALTLDDRGQQLLVDSGHENYTPGLYRDYLRSPQAHNQLVLPGVQFLTRQPTALLRQATGATSNFYEMSDSAWAGRARVRGVLVDRSAVPFSLVFDRAGQAGPGSFQQLWHLAPGMRVVSAGRSGARARTADGRTDLTMLSVPLPGQTLPRGSTAVVSGQTSPYQGWVSRSPTDRTAAPVVTLSRVGRSDKQLSLLVPSAAGVAVSAVAVAYGTGYRITIHIGSAVRVVQLSAGGSLGEL